MRLKLSYLDIKENTMSGAYPTPGLGNWSELKEWSMALNTGKFLREIFCLPEIWDWDRGSSSSRAMTLSILLMQHSSGLNVFKPSQSPDLNPIENLWYDLKIAVHQPNLSNLKKLEQFCLEDWAKIPVARCAQLIETYPNRLAAVIAAKCGCTKYWLGGGGL